MLSCVELPPAPALFATVLVGIKAKVLPPGKTESTAIIINHVVIIERMERERDKWVDRIRVLRLLGKVRRGDEAIGSATLPATHQNRLLNTRKQEVLTSGKGE